jgi:hypothetical protein
MDKLNFMFDAKQFAAAFVPGAAESNPASTQAVGVVWLEGSTGVARAEADLGHGAMNYQGRNHVFRLSSLSIEDANEAAIYATGRVLRLGKISDFSGMYRVFGAAAQSADGALSTNLANEHGVVIQLVAIDAATAANRAVRGVRVSLAPGAA